MEFKWSVNKEEKWLCENSFIDDAWFTFPLLYKDYTINQKWFDSTNKANRKILSISETVIVPAGTFENCIKIETKANDAIGK